MKLPRLCARTWSWRRTAVGGQGTARQPGPFDRALALFDPLLRRAALVVKGHDALGRPRQIGHDEPDAWTNLAGVPLDLGHDTPRLPPALRLIAEGGEVAAQLMRRSSNRALGQVSDFALQDAIGRQPDRISHALGFEEVVDLGVGKGCGTSEIETLHRVPVAGDHWLQHYAPGISAMDVTGSQRAPLDIGLRIAVGTRNTARPPHRTVRAAFPHTAPTLGV